MTALIALISVWWRLPDQYQSFMRYLEARGLVLACRILVGGTAFGMGVILILMRWSDVGPQGTLWRSVNSAIASACFLAAVIWWWFPPTRLWSYTFVIGSDLAIATASASDTEPLSRLLCCVVFASIGGYIAFFHNPKLQLGHLTFATLVTVAVGWPLLFGDDADPGLGIAKIGVTLTSIIVIAVVSQIMLAMLSSDATTSELDPLTGLLNRRGLARRAADVMGERIDEHNALLVVVIDLDRFKEINDLHGHDIGDITINRTALRLRLWTSSSALIARVGGDEFVVVERAPFSSVAKLSSRIAASMSGNGDVPPTSSSIGIAIRTDPREENETVDDIISELFRAADSAMYQAKREGGNQVRASVV